MERSRRKMSLDPWVDSSRALHEETMDMEVAEALDRTTVDSVTVGFN